jgi:DNA repair protein RadD
MKFENQLSKIGISSLLKYLNPRTKELLDYLGILEKTTPKKIANILILSMGNEKIIKNKRIREDVIDTLKLSEIKIISKNLYKKEPLNFYKSLKKLKFSKNSKEMSQFKNFFEIDELVNENINEKISEYLKLKTNPKENIEIDSLYPLFRHQIKASNECLKILDSKKPRVFLHMPTGSGKTRTAINVMCSLLRKNTSNYVIVWLANKEELCDQAYEEFYKAWQILGNQTVKMFKHFGGKKSNLKEIADYSKNNSAVIFSSLGMMYEDVTNNISNFMLLSKNVRLVVMDEAHLTIAKTYKNIINNLAPSDTTGVLGLSATPGRSYRNVEEDLELKEFYYSQKVGLKVEGEKNIINWLIKNQYLAKAKMQRIEFETDLAKLFNKSEISNELNRIREGKDYSKSFREKISNNNERVELIIHQIIDENKSGEKIIVFAGSKNNAIAIADILNIYKINSASITSDTDLEVRRMLINKFKNKNSGLNILVNYDVLTTGFDAPKTKVAIISRPTTSIVLYHQMIGRVVRGEKQGGNKTCKVLTVVDTSVPGYKNLSDSFYFWEDIWND